LEGGIADSFWISTQHGKAVWIGFKDFLNVIRPY
jgi:hypothetical protein